MSSTRLISWSGIAAMLGGVLWITNAFAVALKPEGCIADECYLSGRSMRAYNDLAPLLVVAVLFMAVGLAGLVSRAWANGRFGRVGQSGVIMSVVAISTLLGSGLVQSLFFNGDLPQMPLFVIPAGLALFLGLLFTAIAFLRAQVLPRWAWLLLIASVFALLGFNDQNARVLLAAPLGFAWTAVGCALWADKRAAPVQPEPVAG